MQLEKITREEADALERDGKILDVEVKIPNARSLLGHPMWGLFDIISPAMTRKVIRYIEKQAWKIFQKNVEKAAERSNANAVLYFYSEPLFMSGDCLDGITDVKLYRK